MTITRVKTINRDLEQHVLTSMLVSTVVLKKIRPIFKINFFEQDHFKKVSAWIIDYFDHYGAAPHKQIEDILNLNRIHLKDQEYTLILEFLYEMSHKFEELESFNESFATDQAVQYFKRQSLIRTAEEVLILAGAGEITKAESVYSNFKEISLVTTDWVSPFANKDFMSKVLQNDGITLELDSIGSLIGRLKPGWLVSFLGPMKRGKTWALQNIAMDLLTRKKKVAVVSLEMAKEDLAPRYYMQMGDFIYIEDEYEKRAMQFEETEVKYRAFNKETKKWDITTVKSKKGEVRVPIFDCMLNRKDTCKKTRRTNVEPFCGAYVHSDLHNYRACSACRGTKAHKHWEPVTWWHHEKKVLLEEGILYREQQKFALQYPVDNLRMISHPAYSANLQDLLNDLERLEFTENFVPDVVLIDYADILAPEDDRITGREAIDRTWKALKNFAATKNCLVVTASQAGRRALTARTVESTDISEDIRKLAHVDAMIALNQTDSERVAGVMRLTCIAHRWSPTSVNREYFMLQNLNTGKFFLDGAYRVAEFDKSTLEETASAPDSEEEIEAARAKRKDKKDKEKEKGE